jgi:transposase-like protein
MSKGRSHVAAVAAARAAVEVDGNGRPSDQPAARLGSRPVPDPEVAAKPTRRRFTAEYKLRILREVDRQRELGAIGALLRREGLYSTHLSAWRRERERGALEVLRQRRRGRPIDPTTGWRQRLAEVEAERDRLQERLRQAEAIICAQKKLAEILGVPLAAPRAERA